MVLLVGGGWLLVGALMLALWLIHLRTRNAAIVDVGWAASLAILGLWYAVMADGYGPRRWLIGTMMAAWGLRLAAYLLVARVIGQEEEGRYKELRRRWGRAVEYKFLIFFQAQALLAVLLSVPALIASVDRRPSLAWTAIAAVLLWITSVVGESAADAQLAAFKADPGNRARTCRVGLWRYSRHPNYFFEWLVWIAYALFASPSPYGWIAWSAPAVMLYLLFRVTGIPSTEAQAIRTRGDEYREYQRTTSAFVPWFPRT
jgi:steroid 5-alpha reductase family enzyme